jgi:hypothetical protein
MVSWFISLRCKVLRRIAQEKYLLKVLIYILQVTMEKGWDDIRTEHVHMYMRLCRSCHSPSSRGLYKTKHKMQNKQCHMRLNFMWLGLLSTDVAYQFLPIILCCEFYNWAPLLSWLHMQSDLGRQQTFLHHIGQEHLIGSRSTLLMHVGDCMLEMVSSAILGGCFLWLLQLVVEIIMVKIGLISGQA